MCVGSFGGGGNMCLSRKQFIGLHSRSRKTKKFETPQTYFQSTAAGGVGHVRSEGLAARIQEAGNRSGSQENLSQNKQQNVSKFCFVKNVTRSLCVHMWTSAGDADL